MTAKALVGFAGFGGVDIALREFGFDVTGIEINNAIAEINRANGGHCITADLLDIDPTDYANWTLFHFSPPCPNFSVASQGSETENDLKLARKICEFIRIGQPEYFTLENVWMYRKSLSWLLIWYALLEGGYGVDTWNLNAADYGVPQSRRRMIVIARHDGQKPAKPFPTHSRKPDFFTKPHRGWYEAIEDLVPDLPEGGEFAPWQLDRLPDEMKSFLLMTGNVNRNGIDNVLGRGILDVDQPANTVTSNPASGMPKALLIPGDNTSNGVLRNADDPMVTIQTRSTTRCTHRAFIVGGQYQTPNNGQPRTVQNKTAGSPIWTICGSDKLDTKIYESGKVVTMTPRCLARFQDFPDWFQLPESRQLACLGIGNAVPPGLYRAVLKSLGW